MDVREFIERYGMALGVVLALVVVVAVLPGNAAERTNAATDINLDVAGGAPTVSTGADGGFDVGSGGVDTSSGAAGVTGSGATGPSGTVAGRSGSTGSSSGGSAGTAGGGAPAPGTDGGQGSQTGPAQAVFGSGPHCDERGRQIGISYYMPPCVDWKVGADNGGATFRGVTEDAIKVVIWYGQLDPGTQAILQGAQLSDGRPKIKETNEALRNYSNNHYETYGREVQYIEMDASGPSEDDAAMKADAVKIAEEIKPFAVMDGDPAAPMPNVLTRELAQRGILCMCSVSASSQFYTELPPLVFSTLPTVSEYAEYSAEYIAKKMWGKKAEFAGDEQLPTQNFQSQTRKFGLIYLEGTRGKIDPEGKRAKDAFEQAFAKYGMHFEKTVGYIYDPGRNQQDVTNMIAQMRAAGVTTIVPVWDPLYPILITTEATRQQYFPEWFITGTGLSDTTTAGRLYDQRQWRHAFGISPLWVTWEQVKNSDGYREFKNGMPDSEPGVLVNIYRARVELLFRGIHMAGPTLTNETFVKGEFAFPFTGGQPRVPLQGFTREFPTSIKDFVEVWYGADIQGPDERGNQGSGMIMKSDMGKRYLLGQWTTTSKVFNPDGAIAVSDDPSLGGTDPNKQVPPSNKRCLSCPN